MKEDVYKRQQMTCSIWEDTKYDRETKQSVPIAWYVTWEVRIPVSYTHLPFFFIVFVNFQLGKGIE